MASHRCQAADRPDTRLPSSRVWVAPAAVILPSDFFCKREFRSYSGDREENVVSRIVRFQSGQQLGCAVNQARLILGATRGFERQIERPNQVRIRGNVDGFARQLERVSGQTNSERNVLAFRHRQVVHIVVDKEESAIAIGAQSTAQNRRILGTGRESAAVVTQPWEPGLVRTRCKTGAAI